MPPDKKIVTCVPLSAVWSRAGHGDGTVEAGEIFLDWLHRTGQEGWQLLPLSETRLVPGSAVEHAPSPYKGYGVGFDPKYLPPSMRSVEPRAADLNGLLSEQSAWLPDYALFCALRDESGTDDWTSWEEGVRARKPAALAAAKARLQDSVRSHVAGQWRLIQSFKRLKAKAERLGITIIGDLPFYLPLRSPLVWAHQGCFDLDRRGRAWQVSGVPEGPRSHFGRQVWGHPLYRWGSLMRRPQIALLWKIRIDFLSGFYDVIRLDHAKGFYNYGSMDLEDPRRDRYRRGPGSPFLKKVLGFCRRAGLEPVAEDAGDKVDDLRRTLRGLDVPGIRILRFAYNEKRRSLERDYAAVADYPADAVAYTSTHDTETLTGYLKLLGEPEKRLLAETVGSAYDRDDRSLAVNLRSTLIASPAGTVVIPLQDWLLTEDRINVPGTEKESGDQNWRYRSSLPVEDLPTDLGLRDVRK